MKGVLIVMMELELECYAVIRKGNKWSLGKIEGLEFISHKKIKKLGDVKDVSSYVSLKKYLADNEMDASLEGFILKEMECDSMYILTSEKSYEWDKNWWKEYNAECMKCSKDCKQSYLADIWSCKDYDGE